MPNNYVDHVIVNGETNDIHDARTFSNVAFSGDYTGLINKPTIPSKTSDLTNDSGYITNSALTNYATKTELEEVEDEIPSLDGYATESWVEDQGYVTEVDLTAYQKTLIAGTNITIAADGRTISASGGSGTEYTAGDGIVITEDNEITYDPDVLSTVDYVDGSITATTGWVEDTYQPKLTAGTNITIDSNNVISASGGSVAVTQDIQNTPDGIKTIYGGSENTNAITYFVESDASFTAGVSTFTVEPFTIPSNFYNLALQVRPGGGWGCQNRTQSGSVITFTFYDGVTLTIDNSTFECIVDMNNSSFGGPHEVEFMFLQVIRNPIYSDFIPFNRTQMQFGNQNTFMINEQWLTQFVNNIIHPPGASLKSITITDVTSGTSVLSLSGLDIPGEQQGTGTTYLYGFGLQGAEFAVDVSHQYNAQCSFSNGNGRTTGDCAIQLVTPTEGPVFYQMTLGASPFSMFNMIPGASTIGNIVMMVDVG